MVAGALAVAHPWASLSISLFYLSSDVAIPGRFSLQPSCHLAVAPLTLVALLYLVLLRRCCPPIPCSRGSALFILRQKFIFARYTQELWRPASPSAQTTGPPHAPRGGSTFASRRSRRSSTGPRPPSLPSPSSPC